MKKILLSSLLAVMAVTSANAKIASTDYADTVAASEAAAAEEAAETTAKKYTDGLTGDVANSDYIKGLVDKTLTGAVEDLDSRVEGLTGTGDQAAATKKELEDGLATKLGTDENAVSATRATQDGLGNVITSTYATKDEISSLDSEELGSGNFITGVAQADGKVTVTKGDIAYSDLTGTPTVDTDMKDDSTNAVQNKVIKSYVDTEVGKKQNTLTAAQLAAANSGITSSKVTTYDGYATGKQNTLSETQLAAANSGITAAKVTTYDAYDDRIEQNKEKIAPIASAPVATEGSEDGQYVLTKKVVNGATTYSWELIDRALAN